MVLAAGLEQSPRPRVRPVGGLTPKLAVLREEGVRVVGVSGHTDPGLRLPGITVLRLPEAAGPAVDVLTDTGLAWPAALGGLKADRRRYTRRQMVARAAGLAVGVIAPVGGVAYALWPPQATPERYPTLAMRYHRPDELWARARAYLGDAAAFHRMVAERYERLDGPLQSDDPRGFLGSFDVTELSVVWDSQHWARAEPDTIARVPLEPALFTRVLKLRRTRGRPGNHEVVLELNTQGFGAVLVDAYGSGHPLETRRMAWTLKPKTRKPAQGPATSSGWIKTYYAWIDVSAVPEEEEFDLVTRAVTFNGTQGQTCQGATADWWGLRMYPNVQRASLAVREPAPGAYSDVRFSKQRHGDADWREVRPGDPDYGPVGVDGGSYHQDGWVVWRIPPTADRLNTVYAFDWKWADPDHPGRPKGGL